MLELSPSGSVRGVSSNGHPYRDPRASSPIHRVVSHRLQSADSGRSFGLQQSAGLDPVWTFGRGENRRVVRCHDAHRFCGGLNPPNSRSTSPANAIVVRSSR